jgi:hypothetical protein
VSRNEAADWADVRAGYLALSKPLGAERFSPSLTTSKLPHPARTLIIAGVSAQEYVLAHVQHPLGPGVVVPLLAESNWSNRQIAEVAGVNEDTVRERLRENPQLDRPAKTLGADGKLRPAHPAPPSQVNIGLRRSSCRQ